MVSIYLERDFMEIIHEIVGADMSKIRVRVDVAVLSLSSRNKPNIYGQLNFHTGAKCIFIRVPR